MKGFFKAVMVIAAFIAIVCACALDSEQYFEQIFRAFVISALLATGLALLFYRFEGEE